MQSQTPTLSLNIKYHSSKSNPPRASDPKYPRLDNFSTFNHDVIDESPGRGGHSDAHTHTMTQKEQKKMLNFSPLTLFTTMTHYMIHGKNFSC